jgi:hypothetical protein
MTDTEVLNGLHAAAGALLGCATVPPDAGGTPVRLTILSGPVPAAVLHVRIDGAWLRSGATTLASDWPAGLAEATAALFDRALNGIDPESRLLAGELLVAGRAHLAALVEYPDGSARALLTTDFGVVELGALTPDEVRH